MLVQQDTNLLERCELFLDSMNTLCPSKHLDALCYATSMSAKLRCAAYAQHTVGQFCSTHPGNKIASRLKTVNATCTLPDAILPLLTTQLLRSHTGILVGAHSDPPQKEPCHSPSSHKCVWNYRHQNTGSKREAMHLLTNWYKFSQKSWVIRRNKARKAQLKVSKLV